MSILNTTPDLTYCQIIDPSAVSFEPVPGQPLPTIHAGDCVQFLGIQKFGRPYATFLFNGRWGITDPQNCIDTQLYEAVDLWHEVQRFLAFHVPADECAEAALSLLNAVHECGGDPLLFGIMAEAWLSGAKA